MRIAIIAIGTRGDVQPYIALGKGLKKAGHTVRLITHADFEALSKAQGLEFWPMRGNIQDILESPPMRELLEKGDFFAVLRSLTKQIEDIAIESMRAGLLACDGVDLLIAGGLGMPVSLALAEKLQLRLLCAQYLPMTPTRAFPSFLAPQTLPNLGGAYNLLSNYLIGQMAWMGSRPIFNRARKKALGLPPAPWLAYPYSSGSSRGLPILYGFSASVIPMPEDWGPANHITGYWFLDSEADWTPPPALLDFLERGPAPLYIGFGSMSSRKPEETTELVLKALQKTKQRALLFSGWGGLRSQDLPDSVLMIDAIPHDWLFPRVAAVIHHGGAGTTAAGLRAGIPSILIPFFADQPFWGRRVRDLGVGPVPIPRQKLTVEGLIHVIQEAVTDTGMRQRAAALGAKIRAEDGVATAVNLVQQIAG